MRSKIRCDGKSCKFLEFWRELNKGWASIIPESTGTLSVKHKRPCSRTCPHGHTTLTCCWYSQEVWTEKTPFNSKQHKNSIRGRGKCTTMSGRTNIHDRFFFVTWYTNSSSRTTNLPSLEHRKSWPKLELQHVVKKKSKATGRCSFCSSIAHQAFKLISSFHRPLFSCSQLP